MKNNDKVTLTVGQLKKLIKESTNGEPDTPYKKCQKTHYTIHVYAPPFGTKVHNKLENSDYVVNEKKPFVLIGTVGEEWTVDPGKLKKTYLFDGAEITDDVLTTLKDGEKHEISTKPDGTVNWCKFIPKNIQCNVETSWGETLQANRTGIPHGEGDYIITADDGGKPNLNDRWIVNGEIFKTTYKIINDTTKPNESKKPILTLSQLKKLVSESQRKEIDETIMDALMEIQSSSKQILHYASNINKYLDEINPEYIRLFNDYIKLIIDAAKKLEGYQYF